jgi:hypothetical protein
MQFQGRWRRVQVQKNATCGCRALGPASGCATAAPPADLADMQRQLMSYTLSIAALAVICAASVGASTPSIPPAGYTSLEAWQGACAGQTQWLLDYIKWHAQQRVRVLSAWAPGPSALRQLQKHSFLLHFNVHTGTARCQVCCMDMRRGTDTPWGGSLHGAGRQTPVSSCLIVSMCMHLHGHHYMHACHEHGTGFAWTVQLAQSLASCSSPTVC